MNIIFHLLSINKILVSKEEVAKNLTKETNPILMNQSIFKYGKEITHIGGNPHRAFVGDPFDTNSFGIFHQPIFQYLKEFINKENENRNENGNEIVCQDITGKSFEEVLNLIQEYKCPAIIWCSLQLQEPKLTDIWVDISFQSNLSAEVLTTLTPNSGLIYWYSPEHCALLVGFDEEKDVVYVKDPDVGAQVFYNRKLFQKRWEFFGNQAIIAFKKTLI